MRSVDFPFRTGAEGRTGETDGAAHVRDLIEQLLFTSPGERVMRPDFGAGLLQLVFQPAGAERAAATRMLAQAALQQWLGDVIEVRAVEVTADDGRLDVVVEYLIRESGETRADGFAFATGTPEGGAP